MAKAKATATAGNKSLPAGFRDISSMGGDSWKPEKVGTSIQGVMASVKTVKVNRKEGNKTVKVDASIYTIRTKDGDVQLWQSAGLKALADVKKGKEVFIRFDGKKVISKGQAPMRLYTVATK